MKAIIPWNLFKVFLVSIILILAFTTCDLAFLKGNRSYQYSLVDADGNPVLSTIPDEEFFYINLKSAYYTGDSNTFDPLDFELYAMDDGPGTDCKISVNEESSTEDLFCIFDVMEGDLWYHEINLEYNAPPGMCAYLGFLPHWHYNQAVGYGPKTVEKIPGERETPDQYKCKKEISKDDIICQRRERGQNSQDEWARWGDWSEITGYHCGKKGEKDSATPPTWSHENKPEKGCWKTGIEPYILYEDRTGAREDDQNSAAREYRCGYDLESCDDKETYTKENEVCSFDKSHKGLSNCCLGEYKLIDSDTQAIEKKEWGGDVKGCIGGLARMNWTTFNKEGYPITVVEESGSKVFKKDYKLYPLDAKVLGQYSFPTANFFKAIEDDKATTELPDFYYSDDGFCFVSNDDKRYFRLCTNEADCESSHACNEGTAGVWKSFGGHPFITWSCLDNAKEVKHRIKMLIREWNTQEEFNSFKESEGSRGDPDISGKEGSECDYYEKTDTVFGNCNDLKDADDFGADDFNTDYPEIKYE